MVQILVVPAVLRTIPEPTGRCVPARGVPVRANPEVMLPPAEPSRRPAAGVHGLVGDGPQLNGVTALRHRRPAQSGMVVQERRRAEHRPLECPIARHRSLPKRSQAACIRCIVDVAPRDEGRTRRDRHPTIRSLLRNSSVLYNGRLMRSPRGDGGPLRGFGRAEMNRENAERLVTELFTSSYSATVRYAAYKCGSLDLAEDVVQDAFGALYARLREGASIRQPRAWVLQTVRNKIYKAWHRTERRPERAISRLDLEGLPLPADSFGGSADSARPHLRQFLAGLSLVSGKSSC